MSCWGNRVCSGCGEDLERDYFSNNQWSKGVGLSRCSLCVQENIRTNDNGFNTARANNSNRANFDHYPSAEGTFREVYEGVYTGGTRTGQQCVKKIFKEEYCHLSDDFYDKDLDAVEKTLNILTQWNQAGFIDSMIRLNKPDIWNCNGERALVEPFIEDYQKFNSNTGWTTTPSNWSKIMQALSHYSYHVSSGMFTLCDLQGGVNRHGAILTDPAVHSQHRRFGVTDLGREGISTFFAHHVCNRFCQSNWTMPRNARAHYAKSRGTTMMSFQDDDDDEDESESDDCESYY